MELTFETAELREICEKRSVATEAYGADAADELGHRLADFDASENAEEFCALAGGAVSDMGPKQKCLHLRCGLRVILRSAHARDNGELGATNWNGTTRIKILKIEAA